MVGMPGDMAEDIGEPGLRIDAVEPGGADQADHDGGTLAAAIGAGEQPGLAAGRDAAQRPFCGIVGEADPPVGEEPGEGVPAATSGALRSCRAAAWRRSAGRPWMSRSMANRASIRWTASSAKGEMAAAVLPWARRR